MSVLRDLVAGAKNFSRSPARSAAALVVVACALATLAAGSSLGAPPPQPSISIGDVSQAEGNSGTTAFVFTLTLSAPAPKPASVNFATANGTATSPADYQAASGKVSFAAGESTKTVTVLVNGDLAAEPDETFFVELADAKSLTIADEQGLGTIENDDSAPGLSINDISIGEGNSGMTAALFTVSLSAPAPAGGVTFDVSAADGTATTANSDYVATSMTGVTIPAGASLASFTVDVVGDMTFEGNETFFASVTNVSSNAVVLDGQGQATIVNDDAPPGGGTFPSLTIDDVTHAEGDSGTTAYVFTVTLSPATNAMVTLNYATASGTAAANSDYQPTSGTLTFKNGQTVKQVTVRVNGDTTSEPDETFTLQLANAVNATIGDAVGVGTIEDDDNAPPVADPQSVTVQEDNWVTITLTGSDPDSDPFTFSIASLPANGALHEGNSVLGSEITTVPFTTAGIVTYAPDLDFAGSDSFTFTTNDGEATSAAATVSIDVTNVNDAPVAVDDSYSTDEDTPLNVAALGVLVNDTDVDGDTLTAVLVSGPAHGTLTLNADGSFTYTPAANFNGSDSFTYKANDGTADSNVATVNLTVNPVNDAPVAVDDSYAADASGAASAAAPGVLGNATDVDGDSLTAILVSAPTQVESFTLNADGSFSYQASSGASGSDSFTYKANDGALDSNVATVTITLNAPPVANDDSYSVDEDATLTANGGGNPNGVLANDTDADSDPLTAALVDDVDNGTLNLSTDGTFTYTPDADFAGEDTFTYKAKDGLADSNTATVTITVNAINDAPVLANVEAGALSYTENGGATAITSTLTVSDADSATLTGATVQITGNYSNGQDVLAFANTATITGVFNAATGTVTLSGSDTPANYQAALRAVTYANTSENPSTATRTVSFQANDGTALSNVATRDISVTSVNDAPVNTVPGAQVVDEDTNLVFSTGNGNAISVADIDAGSGSVQVTVSALNGMITPATGSGATIGGSGTSSATITGTPAQVNAALNGLAYRGDPNYNSTRGAETLTVVTSDQGNTGSGGAQSDSDTVGITVTAVSDAPTAAAKSFTVQANMKIVGLSGLLVGATDPDTGDGGYTATFTVNDVVLDSCVGGTISNIDAAAGTFDFDPPAGSLGPCTLKYRVNDSGSPGSGTSAYATITITITGPVIWFVDDSAAGGGTGRLSAPFQTLASASAAIGASTNHRVFLYSGSYADGIALNSGGWLVGQGITGVPANSFDTLMAITPPVGTITRPTLGSGTATVGGTVTLNTNAVVKAVALSTGAGAGLNDPAGAITGVAVDQVSVTTTTGTGVSLSSVAGTFVFTGLTTSGGTGASLTGSNAGSTFGFTGVAISSGANPGFAATGGGTVTVTGAANTIASTTGTALNVANTTIGAGGLTFLSISANGGANGIVLNTTGSSGGLTVTGTGTTDGSGGTIQNTTGRGVNAISTSSLVLKNMNLTSAGTTDLDATNGGLSTGDNLATNASIHLQSVIGATLDNLNISGTIAEQGINGNAVSDFVLANSSITNAGNEADEDGVHFYNMTGTSSITNTVLMSTVVTPNTTGGDDHLNLQMQSGTLNLTISGGSATNANKGSGYLFGIRGTSTATINFTGANASNNFSGGIVADAFDSATMNLTVSNSTSSGNNDQLSVSAGDSSNVDLTATDNTLSSVATGDFVVVGLLGSAFDTGYVFDARIQNNTISVANGLTADGIVIFNAGGGAINGLVSGNTIDYAGTQRAILAQAGQDGNGNTNLTVTGNTIDIELDGNGNAVAGILAQTAITGPGNTSAMCADIGGAGALSNTFTHSLGGAIAAGDIRVRQRNDGTFRLPGYSGLATDLTAVVNYLNGRNVEVSASTATAESSGFAGGGACTQPSP